MENTPKNIQSILSKIEKKDKFVIQILKERERLHKKLSDLSLVKHIFPSDSNQLLVKFIDANIVFQHLIEQKIITRLRSSVILCDDCIRISVGTKKENDLLLKALKKY
jgi:histidinol-phosphate aminotransferase